MESVGIYEAKSKLSELVEKAEAGEVVTITRRGQPVARLVPVKGREEVDRRAVMEEIRAFAKTIKLRRRLTMRELRAAKEWGRD